MTGSILEKNDGKIFEHNSIKPAEYMAELYRVLRDPGDCYLMINNLNSYDLETEAYRAGFRKHNLLVWRKTNVTPNRWYMQDCELIFYFYKGEARTINSPASSQSFSYPAPKRRRHPTEKPVPLFVYYIENSSQPGDTVLDPFFGSNTTGEAAVRTGRNFIGCEIDPVYFYQGKARLDDLHTRPRQSMFTELSEVLEVPI
jgi:site-specific DNA-methyltransferase (adenine-specific)